MCFVHSTYASGASAIAVPGWPELAFWTASMASVRTVLMHNCSSALRSSVGVEVEFTRSLHAMRQPDASDGSPDVDAELDAEAPDDRRVCDGGGCERVEQRFHFIL